MYFCSRFTKSIMMRTRFRIWALCMLMALMSATSIVATQHEALPEPEQTQGQLKSNDESTPLSHDECQMLSAPAQQPALVPSQSSRLVTPAKYRTTLMRTNILRRSANRLCDNVYTPLALSGQFVVERVSAPLHKSRVVNYYVITLCRLLC